jgi:hypothetical protein
MESSGELWREMELCSEECVDFGTSSSLAIHSFSQKPISHAQRVKASSAGWNAVNLLSIDWRIGGFERCNA